MVPRFMMPGLACPFDEEISGHVAEVEEHVIRWAQHYELPGDDVELSQTKVGRLAARTTPRASVTALELLADWQMWLFLFDDRYSDESATGADLLRLSQLVTDFMLVMDNVGGIRFRSDPFTAALGNLMDRLMAMATDWQAARFVHAVRGYFLSQFWEAGHRADDRPAGLDEYTTMRRHSGAVPTCMALIDLANGFELPADLYWRPDVRAVSDIAVNVTCWANDILSFPKESQRSLKVHSLPAVLAAERGLGVFEAITMAADMHDGEVDRYLEAERVLRAAADAQLLRYLRGLRSWMAGNFHWSLETGRYDVAVCSG